MNKYEIIVETAYCIASKTENFQEVKGAGIGNYATNEFMAELRRNLIEVFGTDFSEKKISGKNSFAVDFYIPEEKSIIEVALGLPNTASEFEKDILKAIMAKELGSDIENLIFISRAGAIKKCNQPGRKAIQDWVKDIHNINIKIYELPGEPRKRINKIK